MAMMFCVSVLVLSEHIMSIPARCQSSWESDSRHGEAAINDSVHTLNENVDQFLLAKDNKTQAFPSQTWSATCEVWFYREGAPRLLDDDTWGICAS